jgi:predicted nucleotidyltransferase component of viral defense system
MSSSSERIEQEVRRQLLEISRQRNEDFQFVLTRYALERLLYRLASSKFVDKFVLKGAFLFEVWLDQPYRPTKDLDLLGFGDHAPDHLAGIFGDICRTDVEPDGLIFDAERISVSEIREHQEYEGLRIKLPAFLGNARIPLQIDIAFGDAVTPNTSRINFPPILRMPAAAVLCYPKETVIAEKLQAAVYLDMQNSRMKDFCDIYWLSRFFDFDGDVLVRAIRATFKRRKTSLPDRAPVFMSQEFTDDRIKQSQWQAFIGKTSVSGLPYNLEMVVAKIKPFLFPALKAAGTDDSFRYYWPAEGPWRGK